MTTPILAAINHVLRGDAWARERLAAFAGETIELRGAPLPALRLRVADDGLLGPAASDAQASLVVALKPQAPAALLRGHEHFLREIDVSGNARLADTVMLLARHLRWDFEEDLSRVVGDVAAHRLAEVVRGFAAWQADAAGRLTETLSDYLAGESRLLVRRGELQELAREAAGLRDALERLEQRMRRLG